MGHHGGCGKWDMRLGSLHLHRLHDLDACGEALVLGIETGLKTGLVIG